MTIKDIAAQCGVSVATVSRVMNNQPYVREEIREKVLKALEEQHFVRHSAAVGLVKPADNTIGLVIRGINNSFFGELGPLIKKEVKTAAYSFVMESIHSSDDELAKGAEIVKSHGLKGLILLGGRYDYAPEDLAAIDVPVVCCTFGNNYGTLPTDAYSSVGMDDVKVAKVCTEHLIELGHKRIVMLAAADNDHSVSSLRVDGYKQAMEEHGIDFDADLLALTGNFNMPDAYQMVRDLVRKGIKFTAMLAISDMMAVAAIKALNDEGLRVPEDCSVIGIDGIEWSAYTIPTLTTMIQPKKKIAEETVRILKQAIENPGFSAQVTIDPDMRVGMSAVKAHN